MSAEDGVDGYWRGFRYGIQRRLRAAKIANVLKGFMLARQLKSFQNLPATLLGAANLLMPGIGNCLASFHGVTAKRSSVFTLDLAWMQLRKERWSPDARIYGWADASPQAGGEWFLS